MRNENQPSRFLRLASRALSSSSCSACPTGQNLLFMTCTLDMPCCKAPARWLARSKAHTTHRKRKHCRYWGTTRTQTTLSLASAFSVYSSLSQVLRKVLSTPLALPFFSFSRLSLLLPPSFFTKALSSPAIFSMTKLPLRPQARYKTKYQRQINNRIVSIVYKSQRVPMQITLRKS